MSLQPTLIVSASLQKRKAQAVSLVEKIAPDLLKSPAHPDLVTLDSSPSIGIAEVRQFQKKINFRPFRANVIVAVIPQAEKLTVPAQNALLKTLEEPPDAARIFLLSPKKEALLPTIVSRCQVIHLPEDLPKTVLPETIQLLSQIITGGAGERLRLAEAYKNRESAKEIVTLLLYAWRQILLQNSLQKCAQKTSQPKPFTSALTLPTMSRALRQTENARRLLEANVNPSLVIEDLFLNYPGLKSSLSAASRCCKDNSQPL